MVIASVVKSVGVANPIQWIRKVKSTYVETMEQEDFVASLPAVIDSKISEKYPNLASVIALGVLRLSLQQHQMHHGSISNTSHKAPATIEDIGLSPDQIVDYSRVFNLYDVDGNGTVSVKELAGILSKLNSSISPEAIIRSVDKDQDDHISRFEFLLALSSVGN